MKADIHPNYAEITITCACGNQVKTRATIPSFRANICSQCHPFYTGKKQMIAEKGGRIEQFNRRYSVGQEKPADKAAQA